MKLLLKLVDLISQVSYYGLISTYVHVNHLFVRFYSHLDILGSVRILQGIDSLLILVTCWRYRSNHDSFAISSKGVLEHSGQLAISKWNEKAFLILVTKSVNAIGQG